MASLILKINTYSLIARPRQKIERILSIKAEPDSQGRPLSAALYFYLDDQLPEGLGRIIRLNPTSSVGSHVTIFLPMSSYSDIYHIIQTESPISMYIAFEGTATPNATKDLTFFQLFTSDEATGEGFQDPDMEGELNIPT